MIGPFHPVIVTISKAYAKRHIRRLNSCNKWLIQQFYIYFLKSQKPESFNISEATEFASPDAFMQYCATFTLFIVRNINMNIVKAEK